MNRNALPFFLAGFFLLLFFACDFGNDEEKSFLSVKAGDSWGDYSDVRIVIQSLDGAAIDTVFDDSLKSKEDVAHLAAPHYHGGKARVIIQGYKGGKLVFEETFVYDGSTGANSDKVVNLFPDTTTHVDTTHHDTTHTDTTHHDTTQTDTTQPKPHSLVLARHDATMYLGEVPLVLQALPADEWKGFTLQWTSSDTGVAAVSNQGAVTAIDSGTATIRVTAFGLTDTVAIRTVRDAPRVDAGGDEALTKGASRDFAFTAKQAFGGFVKLAWDWNGDGVADDSALAFTEAESLAVTRSTGSHAYPDTGTFTLRFWAWDTEGNRGETSKILRVTDKPIPLITGLKGSRAVVSIKDSVSFSARLAVEGGKLASYAWNYGEDTAWEVHALAGLDSAVAAGGHVFSKLGNRQVTLRLVDSLGTPVTASVQVEVRLDPPVVSTGPDTVVTVGTAAHLRGSASDSLGSVVRMEWEADGAVHDAPEGRYDFTPARTGTFDCLFRAFDDDGNSSEAKMTVTVENPPIAKDLGVMGYAVVEDDADYASQPSQNAKVFAGAHYNSTGNRIWLSHDGTGKYLLEFEKLIGPDHQLANVQVTSYGNGFGDQTDYCNVESNARGEDADVRVGCWGPTGARKDSRFAVIVAYGRAASTGSNAGTLVLDGSGYSAPKAVDSSVYSSAGQGVTVKRGTGTGHYDLVFKGMKDPNGSGGNLMVTPYGSNSNRCQVTSWQDNGSDVDAVVFCSKYDGTGVNTGFSAALLGPPKDSPNVGYGFVYVVEPFPKTNPDHSLTADKFMANYGNPVLAVKNGGTTSDGDYTVTLTRLKQSFPGRPGAIFVTAYGDDGTSCRVSSHADAGDGRKADIHCYNKGNDGRSDSPFLLWMFE